MSAIRAPIEQDAATEEFLHKRGNTSPPFARPIQPLPSDFLKPSRFYGVWSVVRIFALLGLFLFATPRMMESWGWGSLILLSPLIGAYAYKLSIVMHDCCHWSLFASRWSNRLIGYLCGAALGTHFIMFQHNHWGHHRLYGRPGDPQGDDYLGLQNASRRQIATHLLRPLWGANLFKLLLLNRSSAKMLEIDSRIERCRLSWAQRGAHVGLLFLVQSALLLLVTRGGSMWWLFWVYPASAATFGLFFSQLRGFCEHVPEPGAGEQIHVRTHLPNFIDRLFFYDLNFNFHVEHHLFPSVPSMRLQAIHRAIRLTHHSDRTLSPSLFHTIKARWSAAPR